MLRWLTPSSTPTATRRVALEFPDSPSWLAALRGALLLLTDADNWESYGVVSPEDTANRWWDAYVTLEADMGAGSGMVGCIVFNSVWGEPENGLICNGGIHLIADYPELFAAIGYAYSDGPPEGYFGVPNIESAGFVSAPDSSEMNQNKYAQPYASGSPVSFLKLCPVIIAR